jgi:ABC-type lipoprotein export system ATPase subunit
MFQRAVPAASQGNFFVIPGLSGSGKPNFLNTVGGLDAAQGAKAWIKGHQLAALDERGPTHNCHDHGGFVVQIYSLVPCLTARENIQNVPEIARDTGLAFAPTRSDRGRGC